MASGNLFLGYGKGSVGDVTFYRRNGKQVSRARNRNPRNPRTNSQLYQRAVMATVMQAYSAGKAIFDHSFQGKAPGEECQRYFMKRNTKLLRSLLANDLNEAHTPALCGARFVAPGAIMPVPNSYLISEGTYDQQLFGGGVQKIKLPHPTSETSTVAAYAAANGLIAGDLYTVVLMSCSPQQPYITASDNDPYKSQLYTIFDYTRFRVRDNLANMNAALTNLGQLFEVFSTCEDFDASQIPVAVGDLIEMDLSNFSSYRFNYGGVGIIRSREDSDLRSTSYMSIEQCLPACGIVSPYVLDIWKNSVQQVGGSDLILEGGFVPGATTSSQESPSYAPSVLPPVIETDSITLNNPGYETIEINGEDYNILTVEDDGVRKYVKIDDERSGHYGQYWASPACVTWAAAPAGRSYDVNAEGENNQYAQVATQLIERGFSQDLAYAPLVI